MKRFRSKATRSDDGAVAVELAFVLPILLMLIFGVIEYGRVFSQLEVYESAAREGARAAAVRGTSGDVVSAVQDATFGYPLTGTPSASMVCTEDTVGQYVTVSWSQDFTVDVAILPPWTQTKRIEGTFRCE